MASPEAFAQSNITPDDTLGAQSAQVQSIDATADRIDGGAQLGPNLFHSFLEFNVGANQQVYFSNPAAIENIFSRVTGGSVSNIFGMLGVEGEANLFFLNPKGIVFGENASLDIEGSFVATTADAIAFEDGIQFSAIAPQSNSPLTLSIPLGLQPAPTSGTISTVGPLSTGQNLTLAAAQLSIGSQLSSGADMTLRSDNVVRGDARYQSGGNFRIESADGSVGNLNSPNGSVIRADGNVAVGRYFGGSLHILAGGSVDLNNAFATTSAQSATAEGLNTLRETLSLSDGTVVTIDGAVQPTIDIRAGDRRANSVAGRSILTADINVERLLVNAPDGLIFVTNQTDSETNIGNINITGNEFLDGVSTLTEMGKGGTVVLQSQNNIILTGAIVSTSSSEQAGSVVLLAGNDVRLDALSEGGFLQTAIINTANTSSTFNTANTNNIGGSDNGNIRIRAQNLEVLNGAAIDASSLQVSGNGGDIIIEVADTVRFDGVGVDASGRLLSLSGAFSSVFNSERGDGGDIQIFARNVEVTDGARLNTSTVGGEGKGGDIIINTTETVRFDGVNSETDRASVALSTLPSGTTGQGGDISITARDIDITNGARLNSGSNGIGDSGRITLNSTATTRIDGGAIASNLSAGAQGNGGDIQIKAGALEVTNGGQIFSDTDSIGDAGDIEIKVDQTAVFSGRNPRAEASSGVFSGVSSNAQGRGGDIQITANNVVIEDRARVTADSVGEGDAGNIVFNVSDQFLSTDGRILTDAASNAGGNITLRARTVQLSGDSDIFTAAVGNQGEGGNVTITANSVVAFDDSDILAFSQNAEGGNITVAAPAFFGENYQPTDDIADAADADSNGRVDLNASGVVSGMISLPDVSFIQDDLVELPGNIVDANTLIAGSCIARQAASGSFVVSGGGGLSARPSESAIAPYPIGDIRPLGENIAGNAGPENEQFNKPTAEAPTTEPDGIFQLADGRIVMGRRCR